MVLRSIVSGETGQLANSGVGAPQAHRRAPMQVAEVGPVSGREAPLFCASAVGRNIRDPSGASRKGSCKRRYAKGQLVSE